MKNAKARLAAWLQGLSETDRKILALTKAGKTLREIGEAVGKSHEFVRQRIRCKILLIPRIPETLAKEQAKTEDLKSGNFLYVRVYTGVTCRYRNKKSVVEGSEVYDHGLLTQFLLPEDNKKIVARSYGRKRALWKMRLSKGRQPSGQRGTIPTAKRQIWVT